MATTYLRRFYSSFLAHIYDIPPRLLALLGILLLICLPLAGLSARILLILTTAFILGIFAASWDLLVGRTGQISLGHALFFGIGAYSTGLLFYHLNWPLWITIPLSLIIGSLAALLIGFPCLRVKGHYLALVTLAFPIILMGLILYFRDFTRGDFGIWNLPSYFPTLPYTQQLIAEYYLCLFLLLASAIIMYKIANSKIGIVFVSILDDELASKASGINITRYKMMAFVISGLFATLAGSVNAHLMANGHVTSLASLRITLSFMAVAWTIFGGIGTITGPIAGVLILEILDKYVLTEVIDVPSSWRLISYSAFVIILVIFWRGRGLARFVTDKLEDFEEARDIDERGPKIWKTYKKKEKK
jgi:branched-chain amino acid transport system permease protein